MGTPKVTSCAEYFESIAPWVEVDARVELFGQDVADELLAGEYFLAPLCSRADPRTGNPDYVIDCIDNIDSKVELLAYCHSHKIPVFSSLGAGAKSDPSRIQIGFVPRHSRLAVSLTAPPSPATSQRQSKIRSLALSDAGCASIHPSLFFPTNPSSDADGFRA